MENERRGESALKETGDGGGRMSLKEEERQSDKQKTELKRTMKTEKRVHQRKYKRGESLEADNITWLRLSLK